MAKKKTVTTVEEETETPQVDPTQALSDARASKFLGEKVVNNEVVAEDPKEEDKPAEEEVKPEEKPVEEPEPITIDPEAIKKEAVAEAKAEILKTLAGDKDQTPQEKVDEYQAYQQDFFSKNQRQPTWFEVAQFMEEKAIEKLEAKQAAKEQEAQDAVTKRNDELQKQNEATNKYVDEALNELYTAEKLPRIGNKDDKDDYGLRVRKELFNTIIEVNNKRMAENLAPKTIKEIFYEDFKVPPRQVAGADAPVNMGRGGYTPDESEEINYKRDIAGPTNSFRALRLRAMKALQR